MYDQTINLTTSKQNKILRSSFDAEKKNKDFLVSYAGVKPDQVLRIPHLIMRSQPNGTPTSCSEYTESFNLVNRKGVIREKPLEDLPL